MANDSDRLATALRELCTQWRSANPYGTDRPMTIGAKIAYTWCAEQVEDLLAAHQAQDGDAKDAARLAELDTANVGLADESVRLQNALSFYANGEHLAGCERWDSASGEPENWLCDPSGSPAMVEDGAIARDALEPFAQQQEAQS